MALKDPALVKEAAREFPGRIVVGIDAARGRVAVEGWADVSETSAADLARRFEDCGVAAIVYTDIERDGTLTGLNVAATAQLARAVSIPVIASGGVSSIEDLKALKKVEDAGIEGVIAGRALYDRRLDLAEALAAISNRTMLSDVAAAAESARAAAAIARVNVEVNLAGITDEQASLEMIARLGAVDGIITRAEHLAAAVREQIRA